MKKKFKNVGISETAHEEARFLSKITDRAIGSIFEEYIDYLFNIGCTFEKANLEFEVDGDSFKVIVSGRSNMLVGEQKMPKEVLEREKKAGQLLRVKTKDSKGQFVEVKPK
jgi:hypothetical protein